MDYRYLLRPAGHQPDLVTVGILQHRKCPPRSLGKLCRECNSISLKSFVLAFNIVAIKRNSGVTWIYGIALSLAQMNFPFGTFYADRYPVLILRRGLKTYLVSIPLCRSLGVGYDQSCAEILVEQIISLEVLKASSQSNKQIPPGGSSSIRAPFYEITVRHDFRVVLV